MHSQARVQSTVIYKPAGRKQLVKTATTYIYSILNCNLLIIILYLVYVHMTVQYYQVVQNLFISIYFSYRGCWSKKSTSAARMNVSVNKERL